MRAETDAVICVGIGGWAWPCTPAAAGHATTGIATPERCGADGTQPSGPTTTGLSPTRSPAQIRCIPGGYADAFACLSRRRIDYDLAERAAVRDRAQRLGDSLERVDG